MYSTRRIVFFFKLEKKYINQKCYIQMFTHENIFLYKITIWIRKSRGDKRFPFFFLHTQVIVASQLFLSSINIHKYTIISIKK